MQSRRPIPDFGDITYVFNGGKSRYKALQMKYEWRPNRDLTLLNSLTLSQAKDNAAGSLENQNGNFPAAAGLRQSRRRLRPVGLSPAVQQHDELCLVAAVRQRQAVGRRHVAGARRDCGRLAARRVNIVTPGEMVTFVYSPATLPGVGDHQRLLGREQLPAEHHLRSVRAEGQQSITNWFNPSCVSVPTDPSQPFGNAPRNNVRGPNFSQFDLAAIKQVAVSGESRAELRLEAFNLFNRVNFTAPASNRSVATFGTITGTFHARQVQLGLKFIW